VVPGYYYSLPFLDPDEIRLEVNHVPGKGVFADGASFDPAPNDPLARTARLRERCRLERTGPHLPETPAADEQESWHRHRASLPKQERSDPQRWLVGR
jgi:hypothetical protein